DSSDPRSAFVVDGAAVYRTKDAGKTWTTVTGNLQQLSPGILRSAAFSTASPAGSVIVGADSGVFEAVGPIFTTWRPLGVGLPHAPVYHIDYNAADRVLLAGTLGRGAWTLTLTAPSLTTSTDGDGAQPAQTNTSPVHLAPGVVVQPAEGRVYLATPRGEIEAVQLSDGKRLWSSSAAAWPVGVVNQRLVSQTEPSPGDTSFQLSLLDERTGQEKGRPPVVALPPGIRPLIGETAQGRFALTLEHAGADALVSWQFEPRPPSGVRPGTGDALSDPVVAPPPPPPAQRTPRSGTIRINTQTAAIQSIDVPESVPPRAGGIVSGTGLPPNLTMTQISSGDGRYVLESERVGDDSVWEKYQWTITDRQTGQQVGRIRAHSAMSPFAVSGNMLVYESFPSTRQTPNGIIREPLKIHAINLSSGTEAWNREIRDTAMRGPFPP
ncbi:MAG TPA: hypothetical protein VNZ26_18035, partial [Vicinamibacterales bacterium]|nr:hypothetical protein [Vicinamibacterales bacterium]